MNQLVPRAALCSLFLCAACQAPGETVELAGLGPVVSAGLAATYFKDSALAEVSERRVDPALDFSWAGTEPFSARWTGELWPRSSEVHRLLLTFSGRARLWVDGNLLVDAWEPRPTQTEVALMPLIADRGVPLKLEYASDQGPAQLSLAWEAAAVPREVIAGTSYRPAPTGGGLRTEYFRTSALLGLRARGVQQQLDLDFGSAVAAPQLAAGPWSLRLSGALVPAVSGPTRFFVESDGDARLELGNLEVPLLEGIGEAELEEGTPIPIEVTLARPDSGGRLRVEWQPPGQERAPIPSGLLLPVGFARAPGWKMAALVVRHTDVVFPDPANQRPIHVQSTLTAAEEKGARDVLATLPATIRAFSGGNGVVSLDVITVDDLAITQVSPVGDGFWVSPGDARPILEKYAPRGSYDSVFLVWDPDGPSNAVPVCCWYGQGRSRDTGDATFASIPNLSDGEWGGPFPAEVLVHEWLHGAAAWYRVEGQRTTPDPHDNAQYGFPNADGRKSWWQWYRGALSGELIDAAGDFAGFTPSVWASGTPTQPQSIVRLAAPSGVAAARDAAGKVTLGWAPSAGAAHYRIFRGTAAGAETYLGWTAATSFVDDAPLAGPGFYVVRAVSAAGAESDDSNEAAQMQ